MLKKWRDVFPDADEVGRSEYRAIADLVSTAVYELDEWQMDPDTVIEEEDGAHIVTILEEVIDWAKELRKKLDGAKASTVLLTTVEGEQIGLVIALRHSQGMDAEKQLRAAVSDFLDTKEGARIAAENHSDFNWGDVVMDLPKCYLEAYDLRMTSVNSTRVLDHDENMWTAKERKGR